MWRFVTGLCEGNFPYQRLASPAKINLIAEWWSTRRWLLPLRMGPGRQQWAEQGANIAVKAARRLPVLANLMAAGWIMTRCCERLRWKPVRRFLARPGAAEQIRAVLRRPSSSRSWDRIAGARLQIGDGAIVVSDGGNGWGWVFWPQRDEYAEQMSRARTRTRQSSAGYSGHNAVSTPTRHDFLTDADALERLRIAPRLGKVTDIALMTDGLESLAMHYASTSAYEPFFRGMFRPILDAGEASVNKDREIKHLSASLDRFLSSDRVRSRTDDDVSLVLASCRR